MDEFSMVRLPEGAIMEEEEFEILYNAPAEIVALLSLFYGSISIMAVIGNTLVIWVVATTRQMRTVTNMYIANLAFADVIIGLFCIPFQFQAALLQRWNLPWFMCGFCPFVQALSVNVSVFTLTAIAIDRHRAIINPLRARPTKFISKIIIIAIWLVALTFAIPCAIAFRVDLVHERIKEDDVIYNISRPFCMNKNLSEDQLLTYRYTLVFVQYLVPFCVISFVYIQMAVRLWGTRAPGNAQDTRDITLLRNKKKVIKMLIIVVIVFGLCWLPLQLYNILYVTISEVNEYRYINIVWFSCDWLAMSNSCYNPFIYGIYNEKFKREFNRRFAACFCKFHTSLDAQERTMSMHTRASSIRSTYANSSMRVRNGKLLSLNNQMLSTSLVSQPGTMAPGMQRNGHVKALPKNASNGMYNIIACNNNGDKCDLLNGMAVGATSGVAGVAGAGGGAFMYPWRRNNFRPLQPDVMEHEDDVGLMDDPSTSPTSEAPNGAAGARVAKTGDEAQQELLPCDSPESSSCICEQELGGRTECDGTCILNEVSRVQAPPQTAQLAATKGKEQRHAYEVDFAGVDKGARVGSGNNAHAYATLSST